MTTPDSPEAAAGVLARIEAAGLPRPPVPEDLLARARALDDWVITTRDDDRRPYDLAPFVAEVTAGDPAPYALVGHDGHGLASWAMHLYVVTPVAAVFDQTSWGAAVDDDNAAEELKARYTSAETVLLAADRARRSGGLTDGTRLVVIATDMGRSRWAFVEGSPGPENVAWQDGGSGLSTLLAAYAAVSDIAG